ncbi:MAG: hypothetical protein PVH19_04115, partial [Planctomycetia bacterium]
MSQESNHKKNPQRRLTIETMEDRLLLSISPGSSFPVRDFVEVEYVPPTTEEAAQRVDVFDFSEIARQFNSVQVSEHVGATMTIPTLPEEGTAIKLDNPATFLSASESQAQVPYDLADRLSDELSLMDWGSIQSDSALLQTASDGGMYASTALPEETTDRTDRVDHDASTVRPDFIQNPDADGTMREEAMPSHDDFMRVHEEAVQPDFTLNGTFDSPSKLDSGIETVQILTGGDLLNIDIDMAWGLSASESVLGENLIGPVPSYDIDMADFSLDHLYDAFSVVANYSSMFDSENLLPGGYRPGGAMFDIMPSTPGPLDLALEGGFIDHLGDGPGMERWFDFLPAEGSSSQRLAGPDYTSNSWDSQVPPPTTYGPSIMDVLSATAGNFYQELFYGNNSAYGSNSMNQTSPYYSSPNHSYVQNTSNEEDLDTEESLFGSSNSGDGSTDDAEQLVDGLEIKGLLITDVEDLLVESEIDSEGEGGMIDFSSALTWAQKPIVATPEGIVQAGIQQD